MNRPIAILARVTGFVQRSTGHLALGIFGWRVVNEVGELPKKFVLIAAPHTSHWDVFFALCAGVALGLPCRLIVKQEMIDAPVLGALVTRLGGVGVDRDATEGFIDSVAAYIEGEEEVCLCISPPATRSLRRHWKVGFYEIALRAGVPVVCAYVDYRTRRVGMRGVVHLHGDVEAELALFRGFFEGVEPRFPESLTPVLFPEGYAEAVAARMQGGPVARAAGDQSQPGPAL